MNLTNQVEAVLFASGRRMSIEEIAKICRINDLQRIKQSIEELRKKYNEENPIMLTEDNEHYKLNVREQYLRTVRKVAPQTELSKTMMETLAVVAWKSPILQCDVIKIRTNKAYDHLAELEKSGFITREKNGRTKLIKLTQKFLDYFDIDNEEDIKKIFKRAEKKDYTLSKEKEAKLEKLKKSFIKEQEKIEKTTVDKLNEESNISFEPEIESEGIKQEEENDTSS
ncbi:SMC-Scp complex subunit ScpB [Candidatus Woesearchaeota archaeon]|nr:MAG: SMC-Scp complex subunit ScpB [Candidatus Woesearchaeota archaeon]